MEFCIALLDNDDGVVNGIYTENSTTYAKLIRGKFKTYFICRRNTSYRYS